MGAGHGTPKSDRKGWPRQSLCGAQFPAQNMRLGTSTPQCLPALSDAPLCLQHWRLLLPQLPLHPMQVTVSRRFLASLVACRPSLCTGERWQRQLSLTDHCDQFDTRFWCVSSGYLEVNATTGKNLFYWFAESRGNPAKDPLVVWFQGVSPSLHLHCGVVSLLSRSWLHRWPWLQLHEWFHDGERSVDPSG